MFLMEGNMNNKFFNGLIFVFTFGLGLFFIGCPGNSPNEETKTYAVTIGQLAYGDITASPTSGTEGTVITLTITPNNGYKLKAGTLKYSTTAIDETTKKFNLPAENVIIMATFETISSYIVGNWVGTYQGFELTIQIKSDNTFVIRGASEPDPSGTYSLDGNTIAFTFLVNGPPDDRFSIWTVSENSIISEGITFMKQE
jgi:hypothetical protein